MNVERVTVRALNGQGLFKSKEYSVFCDAMNQITAIEDILGDEYDLDRLKELVEADREGRCVVLPVKEGTMTYHIMRDIFGEFPPEIFEAPFHFTDYYNIGNTVFLTEEAAEAALKGEQDV